jgi:hypothetical protein
MRATILLLAAGILIAADPVKTVAAPIVPGVHYADNLTRIPAADPAATRVPERLATMRVQHPRLIFSGLTGQRGAMELIALTALNKAPHAD